MLEMWLWAIFGLMPAHARASDRFDSIVVMRIREWSIAEHNIGILSTYNIDSLKMYHGKTEQEAYTEEARSGRRYACR